MLKILAAILVASCITTIILVSVVPEINRPLDTSFREAAFELLSNSINYQASTCLTCLFHQEKPGGLFGDYQVYRDVIEDSAFVKFPHLNPQPSKVQMYMEQTKIDYPSIYQPLWLMVNLEYLDSQLKKTDPPVTMVFVKTRKQAELLANYRRREKLQFGMVLTGHTSNDPYNSSYTQDYSKFIHIAGISPLKNTRTVVETWLKHPEWPMLTVVTSLDAYKDLDERSQIVANIDFHFGRLPLEELARLQNTHGIHVCPSHAKGFGQYINEARALKAVVITSNASPMNKLVTDKKNGILIGSVDGRTRGVAKAPVARITASDIEQGVARVMAMSIEERKAMGDRGREMYLNERINFREFLGVFNSVICHSSDKSRLDLLWPYLY